MGYIRYNHMHITWHINVNATSVCQAWFHAVYSMKNYIALHIDSLTCSWFWSRLVQMSHPLGLACLECTTSSGGILFLDKTSCY